MSIKRKIAICILSTIFTILALATIILGELNITILSTTNLKKQIKDQNYYGNIYELIIKTCQDNTVQTGFDESILDNVIRIEDVERDINRAINALYNNREYNLKTTEIKDRLNKNIEQYIADNKYQVDEQNKKDIESYVKTIEKVYSNSISYSDDAIKSISKYVSNIRKISRGAVFVLAALTIIVAIIVFKLNKASLGIGMLATGAIFVFLKCYSALNIAINNILILNKHFSELLSSLINQMIGHFFVIGIGVMVFGLIWILFFEIKSRYSKIIMIEEHSQVIR